MKITFAYLPAEEQEVTADLAALRQLHPRAKVRKSDAHPPFKHLYLTTTNPQSLAILRKILDVYPLVMVNYL